MLCQGYDDGNIYIPWHTRVFRLLMMSLSLLIIISFHFSMAQQWDNKESWYLIQLNMYRITSMQSSLAVMKMEWLFSLFSLSSSSSCRRKSCLHAEMKKTNSIAQHNFTLIVYIEWCVKLSSNIKVCLQARHDGCQNNLSRAGLSSDTRRIIRDFFR